jgi:hypothetical protein
VVAQPFPADKFRELCERGICLQLPHPRVSMRFDLKEGSEEFGKVLLGQEPLRLPQLLDLLRARSLGSNPS